MRCKRKEVIGDCTLYLGDCMEIMPTLGKVDAVVTDPPYGTTQCAWDAVLPFDKMWAALGHCTRPETPVLLFGAEPFSSGLRLSNLKRFRYDWIWEKSKATGFLNAKRQPLRAHEIISVFYHKQPTYSPILSEGDAYDKGLRKEQTENDVYGQFDQVRVKSLGGRYPRSVKYYRTAEREGGYHKTQKPIGLLEYLIETYTVSCNSVLDFTMGSGTTLVACAKTGRAGIGIELDPEYFDIACNRVEEAYRRRIAA